MDRRTNIAAVCLLVILLPPCSLEELHMQIAAPNRQTIRLSVPFTRSPSQLIRAGITTEIDIQQYDIMDATPQQILDLFCDKIFSKNSSVLMSISYNDDTKATSDYLLKVTEILGIPVINWDPFFQGSMESGADRLVLQMGPTVYHDCTTMFKLMERYNWTEFSIITTTNLAQDFIECMREMVKLTSVTQNYLVIPRYKNIATVVLNNADWKIFLNDEQTTEVKEELQALIKAKSRIIFLHSSAMDATLIFEVAESLQIVGTSYGWVVTSLTLPEDSDLEGQNIGFPQGVLAIHQNRSAEKINEAMTNAARVWKEGLKNMVVDNRHNTMQMAPSYDCNSTNFNRWRDGATMYQYMKDVVLAEDGMPPVSFTKNGIIEHVELNIYNVKQFVTRRRGRLRKIQKFKKVGRVYPTVSDKKSELTIEMNEIMWPGKRSSPPKGKPDKRFFRIVTKEEEPFVMYVPPEEDGECGHHSVRCTVNTGSVSENGTLNETMPYCCTGLCIEILQMLAERMDFDYELYDVPDGQWGVEDPHTGEWTGLIKEIVDEKADMILTAFIINQIRSSVVDFSIPFLESGITIMVSIRKGAISPYAFLEPYDFYSWILILIFSVHATGASIFIFEWLSPSGLAQGKTSTVEHKFSLFRSFWLIWAMLFGAAVSIDVPRGVSSRFLANVWALFALVFLASYTANLAAFMITIDEYYDLTGIEDWRLLNPTKLTPHFKFATISNSSTDVNLQHNYRKMHNYMSKYTQPDVQTARQSLKNFSIHAFLYDANVLEYTAGRDEECSLLTVGRWYAMSGYGVGLRRGSELQDEINEIILDLQHNGEIERLEAFWLAGACHAKKDKKDKTSNKIGILNFISAFILLAAGVLLGVLLLSLEHLYFKSGRKCLKKYDKCGCCALVSLSMGKSLTFEQSVLEAIDIQRKHKCKDPICEMHLWKARHQLDMALLKMKKLQDDLDQALALQSTEPSQALAIEI